MNCPICQTQISGGGFCPRCGYRPAAPPSIPMGMTAVSVGSAAPGAAPSPRQVQAHIMKSRFTPAPRATPASLPARFAAWFIDYVLVTASVLAVFWVLTLLLNLMG